jgi:glycerol-3-phosphate dehydrogenase (NAD(P)+)
MYDEPLFSGTFVPKTIRFSVIGAGSWGTALARLLARRGHAVALWVYEADLADQLHLRRENNLYLPGFSLPESVGIHSDLASALSGADVVLFAAPSHVARTLLVSARPFLPETTPIVSATKGIERDSLMLVSEVMQEALGRPDARRIAVLSGPSFAQEVAMEHPTAVTLAAVDPRLAIRLQRAFATPFFRLFTSNDLVGVQLGGALKNVMALCAGISDGLGFASNTKAALMTRGLAEMAQLGAAMGADPATFYGLSGMGDLFLTCTGGLSRNRQMGERIGRGLSLEEARAGMTSVAEGVYTTVSAMGLAKRRRVEMPIVQETHRVLFEGKPPKEGLAALLALARGKETEVASLAETASGSRIKKTGG